MVTLVFPQKYNCIKRWTSPQWYRTLVLGCAFWRPSIRALTSAVLFWAKCDQIWVRGKEKKKRKKETWQRSLAWQNCIRTNHKSSGTMCFRQMRPDWRLFWKAIISNLFDKNSTSAQTPHANGQTQCGGVMIWAFFCSHRSRVPCSHWLYPN